jgi:hypothetical protein
MLTSPPTRPPPAGSATASTGTTPSASSPNIEDNRLTQSRPRASHLG